MAKAVVFLAKGFEEIEAITPIDYLRRAGVQVQLAAIPVDNKADLLVQGAHGISVQADLTFDDFASQCASDLPDAVFVPGGMPGASNVGACALALDFIKKMFDEKKLVCAICAAPVVVLAQTGILAGKNYTCYPGMDQNLAEYCKGKDKADQCMKGSNLLADKAFVVDQNVITGRGPGAAEEFAMAIVEKLCGKETAQKIKAASVQR
ncbi:MAG: DJ-1/PfpI family protein [Treponema sp.]|nr:DJ-1/PfpI family protein [Treponema sp.]